jgi:hypothetical protein
MGWNTGEYGPIENNTNVDLPSSTMRMSNPFAANILNCDTGSCPITTRLLARHATRACR